MKSSLDHLIIKYFLLDIKKSSLEVPFRNWIGNRMVPTIDKRDKCGFQMGFEYGPFEFKTLFSDPNTGLVW
jgi:hypothetical protein